MSSLTANLLRGAAGLSAQSKALEVTGSNLTNANTVGYARQQVNISSGATMIGQNGPEAMQVNVDGVTQSRDMFLDAQVVSEKATTSGISATQDAYSQVQTALGQNVDTSTTSAGVGSAPASTGGIASAISDFFSSVQALSTDQANPAAKASVLQAANTLTSKINAADQKIAGVQTDLTTKITSDVKNVNQLLKDVAGLNKQIVTAENGDPGSANALRDQRQAKLESLSQYMNVESRPDPSGNGAIQVFSRDGSGNEVPLVNRDTVPGPISFDGTNFTAGTPAATLSLSGGSMNAEVQARDGFAQSVRDDLSNLATQLRTSVNAAYNPSGSGQDFFSAGSSGSLIQVATGLTRTTLQAGSSGDAGANDLANAVAAVANQTFSTAGGDSVDGTLAGSFNSTVATVGDAVKTASNNLEDQQMAEQVVSSKRDQVSGVSLDEETTNLMQYQKAYQASARYITTIDSMMDTVINSMGVNA